MSLPAAEEALFSAQIDAILARSDVNTISAKKIRRALQETTGRDLTAQKDSLNDLIAQRFDKYTTDKGILPAEEPKVNGTADHQTNGVSKEAHKVLPSIEKAVSLPSPPAVSYKPDPSPPRKRLSSDSSFTEPPGNLTPPSKHSAASSEADDPPPKKKPKKDTTESDAQLAARLQAELNSADRPTRGGPRAPRPVVKKTSTPKKKKSASKVTAEDDSEVGSDSDDAGKSERGGAFNKPMYLSPALKELLKEDTLSRPKTVKGIWKHIKDNGLQDPNDKREIICDDALRAIFKRDTVNMFKMNKFLSHHLTPMDE